MKILVQILAVATLFAMTCDQLTAQPGNLIGNDGPASKAVLENPSGIAVDDNGNVYIAERRANRIRKVDSNGIITTLAGTGKRSYSGDGGPAHLADIAVPEIMLIDSKGHLVFCDRTNARVRKINLKTGIISTIAGNGTPGYAGDSGPATQASITYPYGLALDADGNIYIADTENHCIRKVDIKTGMITTVAGNGKQGFSGDGGLAKDAAFNRPHVLAFDPQGNLYIGDSFNQRIRKVDKETQIIETIAGTGEQRHSGEGGLAIEASFIFFGSLVFDAEGNLYLSGGDHRIRKIDGKSQVITTVAGTGVQGNTRTPATALSFQFNGPYGLARDKTGSLYVVDSGNGRVVKIDTSNRVTLVAGKETP
jgi:DNA-binding beta-propeller fold protein YncE